jgi:SAM-dependent methyltransferase
MADPFRYTRSTVGRRLFDWMLAARGVLFLGRRYTCPCCGWRLRAFTRSDGSLRTRRHGYCPRCNAKARHRRDWLYLMEHTNLAGTRQRLLHVSPKYALARRLAGMAHLEYVAGDIRERAYISLRFDLAALPFPSDSFDSVICIHVLEHVADDRAAMAEIYRVLRPGGWTFISAPVRLDQATLEDPSITDPEERQRVFGESDHLRFYGFDLIERLGACGFMVDLDRADSLDDAVMERYGLLGDENIFMCRKPVLQHPGVA